MFRIWGGYWRGALPLLAAALRRVGGRHRPPSATAGRSIPTSGPYQPLTVGSTWTFHVDDQGVVYDKDSTVEAQEDIGGAAAGISGFRVRETIKSAIQLTWYEVTATDVRRHHDQLMTGGQLATDEWYDPYLLRVDTSPDHMQANATWTMTYMDTKTTSTKPMQTTSKTQDWHVDGVGPPSRSRPAPSPRCRSPSPTRPTAPPRRSGSCRGSARSRSRPAPATSSS